MRCCAGRDESALRMTSTKAVCKQTWTPPTTSVQLSLPHRSVIIWVLFVVGSSSGRDRDVFLDWDGSQIVKTDDNADIQGESTCQSIDTDGIRCDSRAGGRRGRETSGNDKQGKRQVIYSPELSSSARNASESPVGVGR